MMNKVSKIFNYCRKEHISIFSYIKNSLLYHCGQRAKRLHEWRRRKAVDEENRSNLINKNPSIIASNCNGCTISHDLGLRFNTQFVNLWLSSRDFIKYLKNFNYYNGLKLRFIDDADYDHPVALLDDIHVYFTHYNTCEEAERKWEDRKKRIDWDNVYVLATDQGVSLEDLKEFDNLPYEHKIVFTHVPQPEIKSSFYIKGFEKMPSVGKLNAWVTDDSLYFA